MTYGWAIITLLVIVAALAYFGVFSAERYIPEGCVTSSEVICKDFQIFNDTATGRAYLSLRLGLAIPEPARVNLTATIPEKELTATRCYLVSQDGAQKAETIKVLPGESFSTYCYFPQAFTYGERIKANTAFTIVPERKYPLAAHGEVVGKASTGTAPPEP